MRASSLLVAFVALVACLCPSVSAFTGYTVTQQTAKGAVASTYTGVTGVKQTPLGPFNVSAIRTALDIAGGAVYASEWQLSVPFGVVAGGSTPFVFPFFGTDYTSMTVTSKGFLYLGAYPAADLASLDTAAVAPNYTAGATFPLIGGAARPVISFLQGAGGTSKMAQLVGVPGTSSTSQCLNVALNAPCQLNNYYTQSLQAITSYTSGGQSYVLTPLNSVAVTADGPRFVLAGLKLADQSGAMCSAVLILYTSGLIEIYYYSIQAGTAPQADLSGGGYGLSSGGTTGPVTSSAAVGMVTVGISGVNAATGQAQAYTLASPVVSAVSFAQLSQALQGTTVSFRPH